MGLPGLEPQSAKSISLLVTRKTYELSILLDIDPDPLSASYRLIDVRSMANILQHDPIYVSKSERLKGALLRLAICHTDLYRLNLIERVDLHNLPLESLRRLLICLQLFTAHTVVKVELNATQLTVHIKIIAYCTDIHLLFEPLVLQLTRQRPAELQSTTFITYSFQLKRCISSDSIVGPWCNRLAIVAHEQQVILRMPCSKEKSRGALRPWRQTSIRIYF